MHATVWTMECSDLNKHENYEEKTMRNEKEQVSPAKSNVFTYENDLTGREVLTSLVFESSEEKQQSPFRVSLEDIRAAAGDDVLYQAVAAVALRKGLWILDDRKNGGVRA